MAGTGSPRVIIIGAGIAGLSAAQHLWNSGFQNINVLEAADRIGGRIHTVTFGKNECDIIELGANWIHGGCAANSMFNLANQFQLLPDELPLLDRTEGFFYNAGRVMDAELVRKVFQMFLSWFLEERDCFSTTRQPLSIAQHFRLRLAESLSQFSTQQQQQDVKSVFNCLMNFCSFHKAGYPEHSPWSDIEDRVYLPGGNVNVPCGLIKIVDALRQRIPADVIKLQQEVTEIFWDKPDIRVLCKNNVEYIADHVICTVSLGYLKAHCQTLFKPGLPWKKLESINEIPFGKVDKIFLQWNEPFWKKGRGSIKFAWTDEEAIVNSQIEWYKKIFAFDEVFNNPNVLVGWISGDEAEYMEHLSENELIRTCTQLIRRFCDDPSIPAPTKVVRSHWCTDPYTLGAYSYRGFSTRPEHKQYMSDPVTLNKQPRILFAGEATAGSAYSTMHGARSSGLREAERLIAYCHMKDIKTSNI